MTLLSQFIHCLVQVESLIDFGKMRDMEEGVYEQNINNSLFIIRQLSYSQLDLKQSPYCRKSKNSSTMTDVVKSSVLEWPFSDPVNAKKCSLFDFLGNHYFITISLFDRPYLLNLTKSLYV